MSSSTQAAVHHHAHHFTSAEEEFEACKQGMWIFMVTEVLMLGGLFVAYVLLRNMYPDMFHEAHKALSVVKGGTNTVILITSSVTMMLGVVAAQRGQNSKCVNWLAVTLLLAGAFLVVKYFEYMEKIHHGLLPGGLFTNTEITHPKAPLFFSLYFVMTGIHGLHVVIGMGLIAWIMKRAAAKEFGPSYYTPVELVGFYWHFVDLVWIYLFPLLYLIP
jgi:cytochrome c oxidase subunit III